MADEPKTEEPVAEQSRKIPVDQEEIPLGGAIDYAESFASVVDLPTPIIVRKKS